jgi:hypothetical protein
MKLRNAGTLPKAYRDEKAVAILRDIWYVAGVETL